MRIISLILVTFLLFTQTGCWNAREINELAFVMSIALDKADNGFKITAQIAKPDTYSKTSTGGLSTADKEKPFWVISSTGESIFEAVRNMAAISSRRIFWSHIKVIILSEELAKNNILEIFDFFSSNPELRLRTWIAVTQGEAGKILEVVPIMEKDPSQNIEKIIDKTNITGKAYSIMIKDFLEEYLDPYINPVASRVVITTVDSKQVVKLEGASVFGQDNMIGWLNETETRGLLWIENKISRSIRVVNCPYDGSPVTLEIKKGKTEITSYIKNGTPQFIIKVTAEGKLTEKGCVTDFTDPQAMNDLENVLALAIHDDIQSTVTASQKYNSDFIDLSRILQSEHNNEWKQISSNWSQIFTKAQVTIQVKVKIPEVSLLAKPMVHKKTAQEG